MEAIMSKREKFQSIRWINLAVGLLQLHYWVEVDSWFLFAIAVANKGVFAFTRKQHLVGNVFLGLYLAWVMWYGDIYLEYCPGVQYACPSYCDADHIHLTEDCNENKENEARQQRLSEDDTDIGLRPDEYADAD